VNSTLLDLSFQARVLSISVSISFKPLAIQI